MNKFKKFICILQRLSIHRYSTWVSAYGFVRAHVHAIQEFKRINRFIPLNFLRERSPNVDMFVLIIAGILHILFLCFTTIFTIKIN